MLIQPWDGAASETEWRDWLTAGHDFGQLAVSDGFQRRAGAAHSSCGDTGPDVLGDRAPGRESGIGLWAR